MDHIRGVTRDVCNPRTHCLEHVRYMRMLIYLSGIRTYVRNRTVRYVLLRSETQVLIGLLSTPLYSFGRVLMYSKVHTYSHRLS